ncbi:MAG: hypothetical protein KKA07_17930 [Bacteroidetes bacterium]|nr:hypothetical protein [Bacteroidota bacterium]MBU1720950.1 hypothetical protein [Bacteroidota bacterium]
MKTLRLIMWMLALTFSAMLSTTSCDDEAFDDMNLDSLISGGRFGWFGSTENLNEIENDIYLGSTGTNASSVDLLDKFPPIGNQGMFGTCVAWSVGYNLRSCLNAQENNLSKSQLESTSNQFSPKDLFWAVSTSDKGADCNGTSFESALDILVDRGVATMSTVPYTSLGDCSSSPDGSWTSNASQYKIENYRKIEPDRATIKSYLSQSRPVAFGAKLGDAFMSWNSSDVLTSDNDTYNGQHAYHAMIISGYDDSKGPNGAFRVVNSWGTNWADQGYIWVDYGFFEQFCFAAFVAKGTASNPDNNNDNQVDPEELVSQKDVAGWELSDYDDPNSSDPCKRSITYNVFNVGQEEIPASTDWNIVYIYYNAYDANDYGILLYDYYSNDYGNYGEDGNLNDQSGATTPGISGNWWNHINVPGGVSVAQALYGSSDSRFNWGYTMPSTVTGKYYLVIIADGYDVIAEPDETNNYYYFTDSQGNPLTINNGVIDESKIYHTTLDKKVEKPTALSKYPHSTAKNERNVNTYSPAEIIKLIEYQRNTGGLQKKVQQFIRQNNRKTAWL